jgi:hypothetical protein
VLKLNQMQTNSKEIITIIIIIIIINMIITIIIITKQLVPCVI